MQKGLYKGIVKGQRFESIGAKGTPAFIVRFRPTEYIRREDNMEVPVEEDVIREATLWMTEGAKEISADQLKTLCGDDWPTVAANITRLDPSFPGFVDLTDRHAMFLNMGPRKGSNSDYDQWSVYVPGASKAKTSDPAVAKFVASLFAGAAPTPKVSPEDAAAVYDSLPI